MFPGSRGQLAVVELAFARQIESLRVTPAERGFELLDAGTVEHARRWQ